MLSLPARARDHMPTLSVKASLLKNSLHADWVSHLTPERANSTPQEKEALPLAHTLLLYRHRETCFPSSFRGPHPPPCHTKSLVLLQGPLLGKPMAPDFCFREALCSQEE